LIGTKISDLEWHNGTYFAFVLLSLKSYIVSYLVS